MNRTATSADGVPIAYSVSGTNETVLVFVHGGLADRSFWDGQHAAFAGRYKVIAPDLAGHGESGRNRQHWGIAEFAQDVMAVIDAENVQRSILVGNSLGGAVALEAAVLAGERVRGLIAVDTFHDLTWKIDPEWARAQAELWRRDFDGTLDQMLRALFHPDVDPSLVADVRRKMTRTPVEVVSSMFASFGGYDTAESARGLRMPVRCINGDLYPTDIARNRTVIADFDAVILPHTGHFPMLERPAEFNRALAEFAV